MKQLETGAWAPWLPRGWKEPGNDLSAGSLKEFRELVDRESVTRGTNPATAPDVRSLQPILTALAGSRDATGWSRFKSWLRSVLERREQPTDESWFSRMVAHVGISQSVIRLISYAALAAVVVSGGHHRAQRAENGRTVREAHGHSPESAKHSLRGYGLA